MIARGAGLSYADAASINGGHVIDARGLNRVLGFDDQQGRIEVEPGITVGEVYATAAKRGWVLPVAPGYPAITIGGCVAFNVHGKSQARDGTFGRFVEELTLWHPRHGFVDCSRTEASELFELTVGGMGLTGVIVRAVLRLKRLVGDNVRLRRIPVGNLVDAVSVLGSEETRADHVYSWNDLNRRRAHFGRGVVFAETVEPGLRGHAFEPYVDRLTHHGLRPPWQPHPALVRSSTALYGVLQRLVPHDQRISLARAAFPIVGREFYFRQFGPAGFREYQMLVPVADWPEAIRGVEDAIVRARTPVTLGSLKLFRGLAHNLSFSGEGVCLALDVPNWPASHTLFEHLDAVVVRCGGIVNLSKDSRVGPEVVRQVFPAFDAFRAALTRFDPQRVFASDLSRRIGL